MYGPDFSSIYNEKWDLWGRMVWPFISKFITSHMDNARTWLDLCCGTGGLLKLASERGFNTVGVDRSRYQLRYASRKAPRARLVECDIRELLLRQKFDIITCMFDSLNYLLSRSELESVLRTVYDHLTEKGLFFFDIRTTAAFRSEQNTVLREDKQTTIFENFFDQEQGLHRVLITGFIKQGTLYRRFEEEHIRRGYDAEEIEALLSSISLSFRPYDCNTFLKAGVGAKRLLYVCGKRGRLRDE